MLFWGYSLGVGNTNKRKPQMSAQKDWTSAGYTRCSEDPSSVNYNRWWADHGSYFKNLEYAAPPEGGDQKWLCRLSAYRLWADEVTAQEGVDLQTKMEKSAAAVLADIFAAMPKDPTIDELDAELRTAIYALYHVDGKHNSTRPKGTPRMHLRPTGLLLQALTEQYYKSDAGDEVGA